MQLWEVDGEDLIVAVSEKGMRDTYLEYHGESIRGRDRRLIPPDEEIDVTDGGDETWTIRASEFATNVGYFPAYR